MLDRVTRAAIGQKLVSLSGAFATELRNELGEIGSIPTEGTGLLVKERSTRLKDFLGSFFHKYDKNNDGTIDKDELTLLLRDLNEEVNKDVINQLMGEIDTDRSGAIGVCHAGTGGKWEGK